VSQADPTIASSAVAAPVLSAGRSRRPGGAGALGTAELYNPFTNAWTTVPPMPTARFNLSAGAAPCPGMTGSCIYAAGGRSASNTVVATLEAFDPPASDQGKDKEDRSLQGRRVGSHN